MGFALSRKNRVGPLVLFLRPGHSGNHWLRLDSPVRWRRLDTPNIPWLFERDAYQPVFAPSSERYAVRHPRRRARSSRKFIEQNGEPWIQRPAETHTASLGVDYQSMALFAEWNRGIQAGQAKRNLRPNSGAAALCLVGFHTRTHMRTNFNCTSRTNLQSPRGSQRRNQSNRNRTMLT
jgi:hypothetical protein